MSSSPELLKPDAEVTEIKLQIELHTIVGNLELQNDALKQELEEARANYAALLESSGRIKANLETQLREERSDRQKWEEDFNEQLDSLQDRYDALLAENKNSAPTFAKFPEAADLLNQLKGRRKKSKADLADAEAFLEILGTCDNTASES